METNKTFFSNGIWQHTKSIIALGIPIVISQLGNIIQAFADTIMVGQYGTNELSAAGLTNNLFNLIIFLLLGFSYATTPIIGAFLGKKDMANSRKAFHESLVCNLLMCALVVVLLSILYANIEQLGQPEHLLPLIKPYYLLLLASLPFIAVFNAFKQFCDVTGDTKLPMWIMISGNVINILGNTLFIFGLMGFPELGLFGAGLATLLSRCFMCICIYGVMRQYERYQYYIQAGKTILTLNGMKHYFKVGVPIGIQLCLEASSFNVCAIFMGWIGSEALAAHQIMCTIGTLCFSVYYGVGAAAAILISNYYGQKDWMQVRSVSFASYYLNFLLGIFFCVVIYVFRMPLIEAFTTSEEVILITVTLLPAFFIYQFGDTLQITFANVLRGIEDVRLLLPIAFVAYVVIAIPISYFFAFMLKWDAAGVWWGIPFGLTSAGLLFYYRFRVVIKRYSNQ